eukprot:EG_transcript_3257
MSPDECSATSSQPLLAAQAAGTPAVYSADDAESQPRRLRWRRIVALVAALAVFAYGVVQVGVHRYHAYIQREMARAAMGLDPLNIDAASRPQVDFNLFANGNWMRGHTIPDEYPKWGTFTQLTDDTLVRLHQLVEYVAQFPAAPNDPSPYAKVGAFWRSANDIGMIEMADVDPLRSLRQAIQDVRTPRAHSALLGRLHAAGLSPLFEVGPQADPRDSAHMVLWLDQGGLGMPDREYYLDEKHAEVKFKYHQYIQNLLLLLEYPVEDVLPGADSVLRIETLLAQASQPLELRRDPTTQAHPTTLGGLRGLTGSGFHWDAYAEALGVDLKAGSVNVAHPKFLQTIGALLRNTSMLPEMKLYHEVHLVTPFISSLPNRYVDVLFEYQQALTGQKALSPRWKRVLKIADANIGELVGQLYCEVYFPPESKAQARDIIAAVQDSLRDTLKEVAWMGERTRKEALRKLDKVVVKIGYPDKWVNYTSLTIDDRAPFVSNVLAAKAFNARRLLNQLWKPVDRAQWFMTPQTVNAYYNPPANEIVFPAAILQPPIFSPRFDPAVNYGAMGALVGHELIHGFDDMGRKYDADGNVRDWWRPADARNFMARAALIVKQFSGYTVYGRPINGELTQGENIADLGGLRVAYRALHRALAANYSVDGLTQDQRFFLSWAQVWRQLSREAAVLQQLASDPHAPAEWRVKGPLSNLPEFYAAFDVRPGQPMWRRPEDRVLIW